MSALLMAAAEESILALQLQRKALVARCYAAGEMELGDTGNALLDAPMDPWNEWASIARAELGDTKGGVA